MLTLPIIKCYSTQSILLHHSSSHPVKLFFIFHSIARITLIKL